MQLITEENFDVNVLVEDVEGSKKEYYIEGVFMQSEIKNRNGRIYPKSILESQLASYNETFVKRNRALGELGHPENPTVNLDRVSHNIVTLEYVGINDIVGKAKILDTPNGKITKTFIDEKIQLGISSRGLGSIKESGGASIVQANFHLSAADIVADPSAPDAFVNGIMEGKEWVLLNGVLIEQDIDSIKDQINKAARSKKGRSEDELIQIFSDVLRKL